jgi:biotin carboxylase
VEAACAVGVAPSPAAAAGAEPPGSAASAGRLLLVAPRQSYRTRAYIDAARGLGVDLLLASDGRHSLVPELSGGFHIDLDAPEPDLEPLLVALRSAPPCAVLASDDATVEVASRIAAVLGLVHNPRSATRISRRKDLARAALAGAGLPVPAFRRIALHRNLAPQIEGLAFPCVAKPLALSASRGVIRADDPAELVRALARIAAIVADAPDHEERDHALVEGFLPGREVALEGILEAGRLHVLAIFDKPQGLDGPYFEERYYVTPSRLPAQLQASVVARAAEACAAYGLLQGPVHAELRVHRGDATVLEIAARTIGGDCARLLEFSTGRSLEELVLAHALGRPLEPMAGTGAAGVLMIPTDQAGVLRRVEGVLEARRIPGVRDVVIAVREGYEVTPLPEGGSYLGFVFATGADPAAVESSLRRAEGCLRPVVAPAWRLQPG